MLWIEHIETMDYLRSSVNLRAVGGKDPFIEYRKEGLRLFKELEANLSAFVLRAVEHMGAEVVRVQPFVISSDGTQKKLGRNDMVTITDGTKRRK